MIALGDELVVRIDDDEPYVILGWDEYLHEFPPHDAVAELDADTLMFAGSMLEPYVEQHGVAARFASSNVLVALLDRSGDVVLAAGPTRRDGRDWHVTDLHGERSGLVYAVLSVRVTDFPKPLSIRPDSPAVFSTLFRYDGRAWEPLPEPPTEPHLGIHSVCTTHDGTVWIGGNVLTADATGAVVAERGYVAAFDGASWRETSPPAPAATSASWTTFRLVCDGTELWLAGGTITDPARVRSWRPPDVPSIQRRIGERWHEVDLPEPMPSAGGSAPSALSLGAVAVDPDGRLWISYARDAHRIVEPIYSYDGSAWTTHPLPDVDNVTSYFAHSIAFDEHGHGWAVSGTWDGDAFSQGILLRLTDGEWRLQNWTWPFWRQRWFGLFG